MNWFTRMGVAIDQLGNTIAGGNPDSTISARAGCFAVKAPWWQRWYWIALEAIINFSFFPIDGRGHCKLAWESDKNEEFHLGKSDFARAVLGLITISSCLLIAPVLYLVAFVFPKARHTDFRKYCIW